MILFAYQAPYKKFTIILVDTVISNIAAVESSKIKGKAVKRSALFHKNGIYFHFPFFFFSLFSHSLFFNSYPLINILYI